MNDLGIISKMSIRKHVYYESLHPNAASTFHHTETVSMFLSYYFHSKMATNGFCHALYTRTNPSLHALCTHLLVQVYVSYASYLALLTGSFSAFVAHIYHVTKVQRSSLYENKAISILLLP